MPNINFELNLNKHPKDVPNRALVSAHNVQLSDDLSCLQSELSIVAHTKLNELLSGRHVAGVIPCNKEFILFVAPADYKEQLQINQGGIYIDLYRCTESLDNNFTTENPKDYQPGGTKFVENDIIESYDNFTIKQVPFHEFVWHGGKLKGTFTYNIKTQLILAIAESDTLTGEQIPLKTINFGTWNDDATSVNTDLMLKDGQLALNPEIKISELKDYNYINGLAYRGWYYFFIRYKINSIDYTRWYSFGYPILISDCEENYLFNYGYTKVNGNEYINMRNTMSSGSNTCNTTIELEVKHKSNNFTSYQIGFVCTTKDSQRSFKSLDLSITDVKIPLIFTNFEEYDLTNLTFDKYNYYNVKNIINYKNRLYISNYKESLFNYNILQQIADGIHLYAESNTIQLNEKIASEYSVTGIIRILIKIIQNGIVIYTISATQFNTENNIYFDLPANINPSDCTLELIAYKNSGSQTLQINTHYESGGHQGGGYTTLIADVSDSETEVGGWCRITQSISGGNKYSSGYYRFDVVQDSGTQTGFMYWGDSYNIKPTYNQRLKNRCLINKGYYKFYVHFINKYGEISDGIPLKRHEYDHFNDYSSVNPGIELNDEYLFCVPGNEEINRINDSMVMFNYYTLGINIDSLYDNGGAQLYDFVTKECKGFFLSYEKYENIIDFHGMLFNYDFNKEYTDVEHFKNYTNEPNGISKYKFYSNEIDAFDTLELKSAKLEIITHNSYNPYKPAINDSGERKYMDVDGFTVDKNTLDFNDNVDAYAGQKYYDISNIVYVPAHSFIKDNDYRGSYLEITLNEKLENAENGYLCRLLSNDTFLYKSENKQLIKFTNIFYFDEGDLPYDRIINISWGLNGFVTFNQALIYNTDKVILNTGYNILVNREYNAYIGNETIGGENPDEKIANNNGVPVVVQYNFPCTKTFPYELKRFKTLPEIVIVRTEALSEEKSQAVFDSAVCTIVQPLNSIDLYEFNIYSQDNNCPKTYIHYKEGFVNEFNKRIIRSNPIADESFENSWRTVSPEAYKDITENKGNITNLIALGTTLLVHTEHSIFMFDRDNTLQNGDGKAMQLAMPDIFDVDYKEVVASQLGACGLQDPDAWILDEFGYIFYDNDSHKIYKFASKKIEIIDGTITNFINKYKPFRIRFANDSEHNRLLLSIWYSHIKSYDVLNEPDNDYTNIVLSYNYKIHKWISIHDYEFDYAFNTKQKLYYCLNNYNNNETNIFVINSNNIKHNNSNTIRKISYNRYMNEDNYKAPSISIMVNDGYEFIKAVEYLTWKLYKIRKVSENDNTGFEDTSREIIKVPYSGAKIRVYNDVIDTGYIDIKTYIDSDTQQIVDKRNLSVMNYKKPWFEEGNWNFNYLRDKRNAKKLNANNMSRIYGNYFIIELVLDDNNTNELVEFETLNCKLINNITI